MKPFAIKMNIGIALLLVSVCLSSALWAVPTQFYPAQKVELERYDLGSAPVNTNVKFQIILICFSPVIVLLIVYLIYLIRQRTRFKR